MRPRMALNWMICGGCLASLALIGCHAAGPQKGETRPRQIDSTRAPQKGETRPRQIDPTRVPPRDDITAIYRFYASDPWLRDSDGEVIGIRVTVYFHSAATELGAFVPGKILIWLYEVTRAPDGTRGREYLHGWEFDERDAMGFRRRFLSVMGYHYGMMLMWPRGLQLGGKQIELVLGYERLDGRIIEEPGKVERVPLPGLRRRPEPDGPRPRPHELQPQGAPPAADTTVPAERRERPR